MASNSIHKSVFSLFVAMAMVFSMLPMSAFAEEAENQNIEIIEVTDTTGGATGGTTDSATDSATGNGGGLLLADGGDDSCTCESFCSDPDCVVCKDDATQCFHYYCICEAVCAEGEENPDCPVCKDDYSKCVQAVTVPEFEAMTPAASPAVTIPVGGYVTSGNGKITISGLPSDGGIYVYFITTSAWSDWQDTTQVDCADMAFWTVWTGSVDCTTTYSGTPLANGTTYYVYIAKTELISTLQNQIRSLGEAVVTLTTAAPSSSGGGSSKKEKPAPSAPVIAPMDDKSSGALNNAITSAASTTTSSSGENLGVRLRNVSDFTKENAAAIIKKAKALGKPAAVSSDVMSEDGTFVEVRITVDPELIKNTVRLDGYIRESQIFMTESRFKKYFENKTAVVSLGQEGKFGQTAKIAAKVDLSGFDSSNLYFYSYDRKTNSFKRMEKTAYRIDKKGYLHFETDNGGDIIISNGKLKKK